MKDHHYAAEFREVRPKKRKQDAGKQARDQKRQRTRVNIGVAFERWRNLLQTNGFQSDAEVACFLLDSHADPARCGEDTPEDDVASTSSTLSTVETSLPPADNDYDERTLPLDGQLQEVHKTVVLGINPLSVEGCAKLVAVRSCSALEEQTSIPTSAGPSFSAHTEREGAPVRRPNVEIVEDRHAAHQIDSVTIKSEIIEDHHAADQIDSVTIKSEVLPDPAVEMNKIPKDETNSVQCKTEPQSLQIGFIGAGNMAFGIAQGILMSGEVCPENVRVSAPSSNNLGRFQEMGVGVTHSNAEVVSGSRLIFLAVKPHLIPVVLQEIAHLVTREQVIVSVAAGVTIATVEALLPPESVVLRLMPNLPCVLQEGALLFARGSRALPEHGAVLRSMLSPCGLVEEGPEAWIDAHTGLSGSGVAFVYLFAEALAEGGVKMGMPSALAHRIAAQTVLGAGRLLRDSGKHPAQLRADVCTPGGTTIFGLHELERGGLRAAAMGAVEAATERAKELGRK